MSYFESVKVNNLQQTAFGELDVAENTPYIQNVPVYNLLPTNFRDYTALSGTATVAQKMFTVTSGTTAYGYGAIQSFRALNYRTGQGGLARFTALFVTSAANSIQGVGLVNLSDELSFGFNGTTFGIWYRTGGYAECREIQVTGASGGSTDLTLTLNSVAYTIPLTAGTVQHNAYEIETWLNANQTVWHADQVNDKVIISAKSDGAKSGTYSYSHATSTGTITSKVVGVTKTSTHIPQDQWSINKCLWLDPTNGNVFQIKYQYLGFGGIKFYVEDPETADFKLVHVIEYANNNTVPSLTNPSLHVGMYAYNATSDSVSSSTTSLTVKAASFYAASEGVEGRTRNPRGADHTQTISTTLTNVLTIRNRRTYNYYINQVEIEPLKLSISNESTAKNMAVEIITNPTFSGNTNFQTLGNNLVVDVDTTANTVSGGTLLDAYTIAPLSSLVLDLSDLRVRIPPTLSFCISAKMTSGTTGVISSSATWYEDIS